MTTTAMYDVLGPRSERRVRLVGRIGLAAAAIVGAALIYQLASHHQLDPRLWKVLLDRDLMRTVLAGLVATVQCALFAVVLSILGGILLAALRLSENAVLRAIVRVWVEIFRGLPLLLLIFFIFLGAPRLGIVVPSFWALTLGISLYNSAVMSEIFRAGIVSLPKGQAEAAAAIGLRKAQTFRIVLIPQAVRIMLPALISQLVTVLKETSLGFIIGYTELLRSGRIAVEYLGGQYAIPIYTLVAVVYLLVDTTLSRLARRIES
ncbi:amino acid ABC transporter permease [Nocardia sp. CA-135398]|uniref:amino acid ABC transporter permease n=1 Tax=Nocardia sp. CA-135398 TaxID=3239977 RepID=UPI003D97500D